MSGPGRARIAACVLALAGLLLAAAPALAFEGGEVWVAATGGWSRLAPLSGLDRPGVDGGGGGLRMMVALSDAFGLALEGSATWYEGFAPAPAPVPKGEEGDDGDDGEEEPPADPGPSTGGITCRDVALTLVYAIDVYALVPQLAAGVAAARTAETRAGVTTAAWDVLLRFEIGADYRFVRRFALGLWATFDTTLAGTSYWAGRTAICLRLTVPLGGRDLGPDRESR